MKRWLWSLLAIITAATTPSVVAAGPPQVIVSIKPLHSLVAGVMQDVAEPALLLKTAGSLHTYSLKPSDGEALRAANVVFWIGPGFENFLVKPLEALAGDARKVAMIGAEGVTILKPREGGVWEPHDHGHDDDHDHEHDAAAGAHEEEEGEIDGHIWLAPENAKAMVALIAKTLTDVDAANGERYAANAARLNARIDALDQEIAKKLAPVADRPFVTFHDALQYFQVRYGVNAVGSITVNPDRLPGAKRVSEIRKKLSSLKAACIFAEPQFEPKLVESLSRDTGAKTGVLDPEGGLISPGADLYFTLMRSVATNLEACLGSSG